MLIKLSSCIKSAIVFTLFGVIYYPAFSWMVKEWGSADSYYSHGPLIIMAAMFFLWGKKDILKKQEILPSNTGMVLLFAGVIMHVTGIWLKFYFLSAFSMPVMIAGLCLFFFGRAVLKEVLFPIVYLIFMMPLPLVVISNIVFRMKLFSAEMATVLLNKIGIAAVRDGSLIKMAHSFLQVEAPCSGLRSLIALLAFGAAFAYLTKHRIFKQWILFFAAFPIAIAANVMRIAFLGWVSEVYGIDASQGMVHDVSGYLLFFVAAVGLLAVDGLLRPAVKLEH